MSEARSIAEPLKVGVLKDIMVPMRDGVRLATDLYVPQAPDGEEPRGLPALLTRTPYSKDAVAAAGRIGVEGFGRYFAAHGYAVVVQDVRGRYKSEGVWRFLTDDGRD